MSARPVYPSIVTQVTLYGRPHALIQTSEKEFKFHIEYRDAVDRPYWEDVDTTIPIAAIKDFIREMDKQTP